jgi:lipopolysaccharide transport system ATP-binding protein
MSDTIISVENVSKYYRLGLIGGGTLRADCERWWAKMRGKPDPLLKVDAQPSNLSTCQPSNVNDTIWALRDVSFQVQQGEVVGIIGRNGAGKSTLLKILSRVTAPTAGQVKVKGRVASLLEVGTGFHPELTGRENIYLNGAILGMKKAEVKAKFEEIVAFAEIERFLDTPVKRYSSGMYVRLAFAVAAHLEPEILLVDEVLAVGDAAFQKKCLGKMGDVAKEGRTVLFVSHNMAAVTALCRRALLVDAGQIVRNGRSQDVVQDYLAGFQAASSRVILRQRQDRQGDGLIRLTDLSFGTVRNPTGGFWGTGEDCYAKVTYECFGNQIYRNIELALGIRKLDQTPLVYLGTKVVHEDADFVQGEGFSVCSIKKLPLEPGRYSVNAEIKQNGIIVDYVQSAATLEIADGDYYGTGVIWPYGGLLCDYSWTHYSGNVDALDR